MIKLKYFQIIFIFYYILGLNPFVSFENRKLKLSVIVQFLPRTLIIFVHLLMAYSIIVNGNKNVSFIHSDLLYFILISTNSVIIIENIKNSKCFCGIFKIMSATINDLEFGLEIDYPYKKLQAEFQRKYILIIVIVAIGLLVKYTVTSKYGMNHYNNISMLVNLIFKYSHLLQITFYVNFVQYALVSLNAKISTYKNEINNSLYALRRIKSIYFKLWHVSHRVHSTFGWFLVAFMIEAMTLIIYGTYWMFVYTERKDLNPLTVLRKYFFLQFVCCDWINFKEFMNFGNVVHFFHIFAFIYIGECMSHDKC